MKLQKRKLALVGALAFAVSIMALAQNTNPINVNEATKPVTKGGPRPRRPQHETRIDPRLETMPWEVVWTTDEWTDDDKPYAEARKATEQAIAKGQSAESLRLKYKKKAAQNLKDPLALFHWGYAAYLSYLSIYNIPGRSHKLRELDNPLTDISIATNLSRPKTFNYARMQFLVQGGGSYSTYMWALGERLLKHDPNDIELKYRYADILLNYGGGPAEVKKALQLTQEILKAKPNNANYQFLLAQLYEADWMRSKSKADAAKAIAEYKKYYQLRAIEEKKPPRDLRIKFIQRRQAENEKEKLEATAKQ